MTHIKRNKKCMCTLFVLVLAPMMFCWWNETTVFNLKLKTVSMKSSFLLDAHLSAKLVPTKSTFQWNKAFIVNDKGLPHTKEQKQNEAQPSNDRTKLTAPKDKASEQKSHKMRNVWDEDTSSKNIMPRLQQVRKNYLKMNKYNVTFLEKNKRRKHNAHDLLCKLKNVNMEMIKRTDFPITNSNSTMYLPTNPFGDVAGNFKKCAVVSSSGAMKSSGLGLEIDGHDAVVRFNSAPTKDFQRDVGMKTTVRLMNSQVVTTKSFNFMNDTMYQSGALIMWDPAPYHAELQEWYKRPEFNFSENYQIYRMKHPMQPFYILNPNVLWRLWEVVQENTLEDIQPNPPSSGLLGIVLMMNLCEEVDVYEYLPSRRKTDVCHYFERHRDSACMLGGFHPLMFEKNLIKQINLGTDENIYLYGKVTLPGFATVHC